MYTYPISSTHSSFDRHLSCFHSLTVVNCASVNMRVHVSFQINVFTFFRYICPGVEWPGLVVVLFLVFWEPSILPSTVAAPIYIPTRVLIFPTSSPAFVICGLFDDSHSAWCKVISHCSFNLHFSDDYQCWTSFLVHNGLMVSFGKMFIRVFCPLFNCVVCFWYWVTWTIYIFWTLTPYKS